MTPPVATRRWRRLALAGGLFVIAVAIAYLACPKPTLYGDVSWSRAYLDRNGELLRLSLASDERYRLRTSLDEIAPEVVEATLLYEDRYYYDHPGINPAALLRAAWTTFVGGNRRVGASTISMQLARIRFGLDTRTISGKLVQMLRAVQLERHYSKREILEAYLSQVPYGRNIEGVGAASLIYFGKPADRLSLPEALSLAVIPQNPSARNPTTQSGREQLASARSRLFDAWIGAHPDDRKRASQFDLALQFRSPEQLPFIAPHLTERLEAELPATTIGPVQTTIDIGLQKLLDRHITHYIKRRAPVGVENAVALLLNSKTMDIEAYVGSADFFNSSIEGQVDGIRARRSPGSALKPFVYALAMDQGLIHPMTLLKDAPRRFGGYTPENFDQDFLGPLAAKTALALSRNVPAVQLAAELHDPDLYDLLKTAGVGQMQPRKHYGLAIALGALEVSMEEMTRLYAALANGGVLKTPRYLANSSTRDGKRLLSGEASYLTLDMLYQAGAPDEQVLPGQLREALPVAWKTGTSYGFRDAWTMGVFGPYVMAVWVGRFDGRGNPAFVGRRAAGPLFFDIARAIERERGPFTTPRAPAGLNLTKVEVCAPTGDLPNEHCPETTISWFIPGVSPLKVSDVYRAVPVDSRTGKRACYHEPPRTTLQTYEFWPSDLLALFRSAGISRRSPPPFEADCSLNLASNTGSAPEIRAPDAKITYTLRSAQRDDERIPFSAVADTDTDVLYWFVNDRFVGQSDKGEVFFWRPDVGQFDVRVVDDHGRAAHSRLAVKMVN